MRGRGIQFLGAPLRFLNEVDSSMHNKLVHMLRFLSKTCNAVAAYFGGPEVQVEEGIVTRADDGEVVGHFADTLVRCGMTWWWWW